MPSKVELYIYDLAMGMASQFSGLVGFQLEGIWHTAIVCYDVEWFFGNGGVEQCSPGGTMLGQPLRKVDLGTTQVSFDALMTKLDQLRIDMFDGRRYSLLEHNCNNFSDYLAKFLTGKGIPSYILELPQRVKQSPIAALLAPIIEQAAPRGDDIHSSTVNENTSASSSGDSSKCISKHFPVKEFVKFDQQIEPDKFLGKFKEIVERNAGSITEALGPTGIGAAIASIIALLTPGSTCSDTAWGLTSTMIQSFPEEDIFPILDVVRWITAKTKLKDESATVLVTQMMQFINKDASSTNMQLAMKILCNLFCFESSRAIVEKEREAIVMKLNDIMEEVEVLSNIVQIGISTLLLNFAIGSKATHNQEASFQVISSICSNGLLIIKSPEAAYRLVAALGTLVTGDQESKDLALALEAKAAMAKVPKSDAEKLMECIDDCRQCLSS